MKKLFNLMLVCFFCCDLQAKSFEDIIGFQDIKDLGNLMSNTALSCGIGSFKPGDMSLAKKELAKIGTEVSSILVEKGLSLAFKKDFPNACHLLSQSMIDGLKTTTKKENPCTNYLLGTNICLTREYREYPVYSYHFPLMFIEVSDKGNDSLDAFAKGNLFHQINRKLAYKMQSFLDPISPTVLAAKTIAASKILGSVSKKALGLDASLDVSSDELANALKLTMYHPLESLRVRASNADGVQQLSSFDVRIWPVGLTSLAKLTVCGSKDIDDLKLTIPGLPNTAMLAASEDAVSFWDHGTLDYLNPKTAKSISEGLNPKTCIGSSLADIAADKLASKAKGSSLGDNSQKIKELEKFPSSLRSLFNFSLPIVGTTEAVANQLAAIKDQNLGQTCSIWGNVYPRTSNQNSSNAYSYPLAGQRFLSLSQDLFGVARPKKPRWQPVYPWEEGPGDLPKEMTAIVDALGKIGIKDILPDYLKVGSKGRSHQLYFPGDPRLMDKVSLKDTADASKRMALELAYVGSLAASQAMMTPSPKATAIIHKNKKIIQKSVKASALNGKEPIFQERLWCNVHREKGGFVVSGNKNFNVNGKSLGFKQVDNEKQCFSGIRGSCMSRAWFSRNCIRPETIDYTLVKEKYVSGYKKKPNPKNFRIEGFKCSNAVKTDTERHQLVPWASSRRYNTGRYVLSSCSQKITELGRENTEEKVELHDYQVAEKNFDNEKFSQIVHNAKKSGALVGVELTRLVTDKITGQNSIPGKKRVYALWGEFTCKAQINGRELYQSNLNGWGIKYWNSCSGALKFEVRKYLHQKLLRRVCDSVFQDPVGEPFKKE